MSAGTVAVVSGLAPVEIVSGAALTAINGARVGAVGSYGVGMAVRGAQAAYYTRAPRVPTGAEATILWLGTFYGSPSASVALGGITYDAANSPPYVCCEMKAAPSGVSQLYLTFSTGGAPINVAGGNINAGRQLLIGRVKNGAQDLWQNGAQVATASNAVAALQSTSTSRLEVGDSLNGRAPDADCALLWIWSRYLSNSEVAELSRNPWQIFRSQESPVFYSLAGGNLTLAVDNGALTLAGQSIALPQSLAVANGAVALAGQSITMPRALTVTSGSVTLTGQAIGVPISMGVTAGALGLAGQSITLANSGDTSLTLPVTAGALAVAGQGVVLGRSLAVTAGAVTLAGQSIGLTRALAVTAGALSLTGQSLTLAVGGALTLPVTHGALSLTGQPIGVSLSAAARPERITWSMKQRAATFTLARRSVTCRLNRRTLTLAAS